MRKMKQQVGIVLIIGTVISGTISAATNYVVTPGTPGVTPTANYTSWATAATNIQDAVDVAVSGDVVLVTNGTYYLTNTITIGTAITLRSYNNGFVDRDGTVIDGNYPVATNRCLYVNDAAVTIEGFTITGGFAATNDPSGGNGGGIYLYKKGNITNCLVTGNAAARSGGGIRTQYGSLITITASTITMNAATNNTASAGGFGGGIYLNGGILSGCSITSNRSGFQGGGLYMYTYGGTVTNCTIAGNVAQPLPGVGGSSGYGGALWAGWSGTIEGCTIVSNQVGPSTTGSALGGAGAAPGNGMVMKDCLIAYNSTIGGGGYGGGVACGNGRTVFNCIIRNNSAANGGGVTPGANGLLENCTIVSNSSAAFVSGGTMRNCLFADNSGGINVYYGSVARFENCTVAGHPGVGISFRVPAVMDNCVVSGNNSGGDNWSYNTEVGTNTVWTNSCTTPVLSGSADIGNTTNAPLFVDSTAGNYRLRYSSPCVNTGIDRDWMTGAVDLDGNPRLVGTVDMGAYELPPSPGTCIIIR